MAKSKANENINIEENLKKLDEVIGMLESGELPLEDAFQKYKDGMDLLLKCNSQIDRVEKELEVLETEGV